VYGRIIGADSARLVERNVCKEDHIEVLLESFYSNIIDESQCFVSQCLETNGAGFFFSLNAQEKKKNRWLGTDSRLSSMFILLSETRMCPFSRLIELSGPNAPSNRAARIWSRTAPYPISDQVPQINPVKL